MIIRLASYLAPAAEILFWVWVIFLALPLVVDRLCSRRGFGSRGNGKVLALVTFGMLVISWVHLGLRLTQNQEFWRQGGRVAYTLGLMAILWTVPSIWNVVQNTITKIQTSDKDDRCSTSSSSISRLPRTILKARRGIQRRG